MLAKTPGLGGSARGLFRPRAVGLYRARVSATEPPAGKRPWRLGPLRGNDPSRALRRRQRSYHARLAGGSRPPGLLAGSCALR